MEYEEIIATVQHTAGGIPRGEAERATAAVLRTLAERLPRGEARHLLRELPAELKPLVHKEADDPERLDIDEFLDRVAARQGTSVETALRDARGVFAALGRALSPGETGHLAASLPQTFDPLLAEMQGRQVGLMAASEFRRRVAQRLGTDDAAAWPVIEAVLEALAERIAAGQAEDLIAQLDPLLHPPLRQGMTSAGPEARRMPLDEFLRRVAVREGADEDEAGLRERTFEHVRAVFATLAEAVSPEEWFDLTAELPAEYHGLVPAAS